MRERWLVLCAALACINLTALPARADALYELTFEGVVASGSTDVSGLFGSAGADLSAAPFTATYLYDPTLAGTVEELPYWIYGGSYYGNFAEPILSASITINSKTFNVPISNNAYYGEVYLELNNGPSMVADVCGGSTSCGTPELANYIYFGGLAPTTLTSVGTYTWNGINGGYYLYAGSDLFSLTAQSLQIAETPIPTALPLFVTGIGVLFVCGWCRQRKAQAAIVLKKQTSSGTVEGPPRADLPFIIIPRCERLWCGIFRL